MRFDAREGDSAEKLSAVEIEDVIVLGGFLRAVRLQIERHPFDGLGIDVVGVDGAAKHGRRHGERTDTGEDVDDEVVVVENLHDSLAFGT